MAVFPETPDPGEHYGTELWNRLVPRLELRQRRSWFHDQREPQALSLAAAATLLLVVGFIAGRSVSGPGAGGHAGGDRRRRSPAASCCCRSPIIWTAPIAC